MSYVDVKMTLVFTEAELWDAYHVVAQANPYDGRTRAGRAWSKAALEVLQTAKGQKMSKAMNRLERVR